MKLFNFPNSAATGGTAPWQTSYTPQYTTNSQTSSWEGYNYGWDHTAGSTCGYAGDATLPVEKWYRLRFSDTGSSTHEPYINYVYHDLRSESCTTYDCNTSTQSNTQCFSFPDARMHPKDPNQTYPAKHSPDLLPDVRDLANAKIQCAWAGGQTSVPDAVGILYDVGLANAGTGQLRVDVPKPGESCTTSATCPIGLTCNSGTCQYASCGVTADCDGLECIDGYCSPPSCSTSNPCEHGPGCIFDGFCPPAFPSSEGEKPCTSNANCLPSEECVFSGGAGTCFARSCIDDGDCPNGYCWEAQNKCVPQPAECTSQSTSCECELGDTGTCAPATYQVVMGLGGAIWSYPLDVDYGEDDACLVIPNMWAASSYRATSSCMNVDFPSRDASWASSCSADMDGILYRDYSVQKSGVNKPFDFEIKGKWPAPVLPISCTTNQQNLVAGEELQINGEVVVLDRRSINTTFQRLSTFSNKDVYLEAYVDPDENFPQQRTLENNVGRAKFRVPTFSGPGTVNWGTFCQKTLECNYNTTGACGRYFGDTP
ncbi:MAG: hypothetical protein R3E66_02825 [bacterium]